MYLVKVIIFSTLISTAVNIYAFDIYQKPKWENLNYAGDDNLGHLLDIYIPTQGVGPFPSIITIAGSAWTDNNNKFWAYKYGGLGEELRKNGFAVVSMNHRSSLL